jgi:hypothetical protein
MKTISLSITEFREEQQHMMRSRIGGPDYAEEIAEMDARMGTKMFLATLILDRGDGPLVSYTYGVHLTPPKSGDYPEYAADCNRDDGEEILGYDIIPAETEDAALVYVLKSLLAAEILPPYSDDYEDDEVEDSEY